MFGGLGNLGGLSNIVNTVSSMAGGMNGMSSVMAGISEAMNAAQKLMGAAANATGGDKLAIDKKIGDLQSQMQGDLQKAAELAQNAIKDGVPQAPQVMALVNEGLGMLTGNAQQA